MAHEPDLPQCCLWACRGGQQPASFLLLCQAQRKLGRLACSVHTMPEPHLPHTSGAAVGGHICCLSLHCQGALVVTAAAAVVSGLVPHSPCPVSPKRKAEGPFSCHGTGTPQACLWADSCSPPVGILQMFTLVPGRDQPAGFQERHCWPIPGVWVDYSPKRQSGSFDPGSTESLGAPFPSVGATSISSLLSTTASSLTLSSAQSPASSFTSSWSLGPLPSVPGPQISKTLGQGPEHSC